MRYTPLTKKAIKLAHKAHKDQYDKAGLPYIAHPLHLAECMNDEYTTIAALLHDVVEDTNITLDDLAKEFPKKVINALKLLTHQKGVPYMDYVAKIKTNDIAKAVKIADLKHNSDLTRLDRIIDKDLERIKKYQKALKLLKD